MTEDSIVGKSFTATSEEQIAGCVQIGKVFKNKLFFNDK